MLSIGPASTCDVCLEAFGADAKAPCSIQCGHSFCATCLHHMVQTSCPLCRTHFDPRTIVKLHIDLDNVTPAAPVAAQQEARRLQEAIASVANEGTTEQRLRQLIADATAFLATQPRDMFSDLRVTHRMIAYLCEVKSKQRIQRVEIEEQKLSISKLEAEKAELLRNIEVAASIRRDEKETALAVEVSLRDHCARAHAAYETMVDRYNFVVQEWMRLNQEVWRSRPLDGSHIYEQQDSTIRIVDARSPFEAKSSLSAHSSRHEQHQMKLQEAAVANPDSFLISPLPEFTSRGLATASMDLFSLPDIFDGPGSKLPQDNLVDEGPICDSNHHPNSCRCARASSPEMLHSLVDIPPSRSSRSRSTSLIEPIATPSRNSSPIINAFEAPPTSYNDRDNFRRRIQRPDSRSRTPSESRPPSQAPTRPPSPSRRTSLQARIYSSSPVDDTGSSSRMTASFHQASQGKVNNRLQDLLQDSTVMSSSLPNLSSNFPPSIARDSRNARSQDTFEPPRPPPRSRSSSVRQPSIPLPQQQVPESRTANNPSEGSPPAVTPSPLYLPQSSTMSSASTAANLMEKAKRERRKAEEEERRKAAEEERRKTAEEERQRAERERDQTRWERDKAEKESKPGGGRDRLERERDTQQRERDKSERDQRRIDDDRARTRQPLSSSPYPQASYRDSTKSSYTSTSSAVSHASHQSSGHGSTGRSSSSAVRDTYNAHKQTTKALPVLGTTRV